MSRSFLKGRHERRAWDTYRMLERGLGTLAIFVIGFDFVWYGCKQNGGDNPSNPVWGFLDGFVTLQEYVLGIAVFGGIAFAVWSSFSEFNVQEDERLSKAERLRRESSRSSPAPTPRKEWDSGPTPREPLREFSRPREQSYQAKPVEQVAVAAPKPVVPKPKLTAKELKEKAIQELLGRY